MMHALIIGCGSIGSRRGRILKKLGVSIGLYDADESKTKQLATELNLPSYYVTLDDGLRSGVNVALICTPPSTHLEIALRTAGNGIHLFIEKPLSNTLDKKKIRQLVYTMQVGGSIGLMGQSYRFCPSLVVWRKQFDDASVLSARIDSGQHLSEWHPGSDYHKSIYADPKEGGIILTSLAHSLDQAQWLFGEIDAVSALVGNSELLGISVDDIGTAGLKMKSGAQVTIHNDFLRRPKRNSITVVADGAMNEFVWNMADDDADAMYLQETLHLLQCVERGYQGQPDIAQGIVNMEWMEAVQKASDTGTWQRIGEFWKEATGRKS